MFRKQGQKWNNLKEDIVREDDASLNFIYLND